jgi:hypothetical protein
MLHYMSSLQTFFQPQLITLSVISSASVNTSQRTSMVTMATVNLYFGYYMADHHHPLSLLHSSLAGSQRSTGFTDQELLIHCSAKYFLTIQYVLSITVFCIRIYRPEQRLSSFKLLCNLFVITPIVDSTNGII